MSGSGLKVAVDDTIMRQIIANTPGQLDAFGRSVSEMMVTETKLSFGSSPSPEGGPPGVDTGTLRASIRWEKIRALLWMIMDGVLYGVMLEEGTERMGARPFMRPIFESFSKRIGQLAIDFGLIKP